MRIFHTSSGNAVFGDGSDGLAVIDGQVTVAAPVKNYSSLTINAGAALKAPHWWLDLISVITIRCQTPIILNGAIRANAVAGTYQGDMNQMMPTGGNASWYSKHGMYPSLFRDSTAAWPGEQRQFFPIAGGGANNGGTVSYSYVAPSNGDIIAPYVSYQAYNPATVAGLWPSSTAWRDRFVGLDGQPWRYAAGCGGAAADGGGTVSRGGDGGGVLLIYAPAIIFGAAGVIEARGGNGFASAALKAGGGGGGTVYLFTRAPISDADWAKVSVAGGQPVNAPTAYAGLDGVRRRYRV